MLVLNVNHLQWKPSKTWRKRTSWKNHALPSAHTGEPTQQNWLTFIIAEFFTASNFGPFGRTGSRGTSIIVSTRITTVLRVLAHEISPNLFCFFLKMKQKQITITQTCRTIDDWKLLTEETETERDFVLEQVAFMPSGIDDWDCLLEVHYLRVKPLTEMSQWLWTPYNKLRLSEESIR